MGLLKLILIECVLPSVLVGVPQNKKILEKQKNM